MPELQKTPNIGKVLAQKLEQVGIKSEQELKLVGAEKAFLLVKSIDPTACINTLMALEGAVQGIRWHALTKDKKNALNDFFKMCEK